MQEVENTKVVQEAYAASDAAISRAFSTESTTTPYGTACTARMRACRRRANVAVRRVAESSSRWPRS